MKSRKVILLSIFCGSLSHAANASESVNCNYVDSSAINSSDGFSCSYTSDVADVSRSMKSRVLSPNGLPTSLLLHNKGGYVAWMMVEYYTPNRDGTYQYHYNRTSNISVLGFAEVKLPKDAERVRVQAQLNTSAFWQPIRDIFISAPNASDNIWTRNKSGHEVENIMQWDVWGTTFHSAYSLVQPQHTEKNNIKLKEWATPGVPGDLYVYKNPYNKKIEVFKLRGDSGKYFPINSHSDANWEYVYLRQWGESGVVGDIYIYKNPYTKTSDLLKLRGNPNAYFPTDGVSNENWISLGQY